MAETLPTFIKAKPWNWKALKGTWVVTLKIDGVRALWNGTEWRSRADKPLYNIPAPTPEYPATDVEVFLGNFRDTIRAVRTKKLKGDTPEIRHEHLYDLATVYPPRLHSGIMTNPEASEIGLYLKASLGSGYEGLVLRQGDVWLKVKPEETYDVAITGAVEGTGKHLGRLGALETTLGEVGTGFSDEERVSLWASHLDGSLQGSIVEVSCMHLTQDGKFRHPRFVRMRPDKG